MSLSFLMIDDCWDQIQIQFQRLTAGVDLVSTQMKDRNSKEAKTKSSKVK